MKERNYMEDLCAREADFTKDVMQIVYESVGWRLGPGVKSFSTCQ